MVPVVFGLVLALTKPAHGLEIPVNQNDFRGIVSVSNSSVHDVTARREEISIE